MILFLSFFLLLLFTGCTPVHYVEKNSNGVTLYLEAPQAQKVHFASSADNFRIHPATKGVSGRWLVAGLTDREFEYFYLVDGKLYVPECRYHQQDDFGADNCIYQP